MQGTDLLKYMLKVTYTSVGPTGRVQRCVNVLILIILVSYAHVTIINKLLSFYNSQQYSKMNNCQLSLVSHNSFALFAYI